MSALPGTKAYAAAHDLAGVIGLKNRCGGPEFLVEHPDQHAELCTKIATWIEKRERSAYHKGRNTK